jgi:branched-chain amino acid transport system substrate-binding protein
MKLRYTLVCVLASFLLLVCLGKVGWSKERTVKYGHVSSFSGPAAAWGMMVQESLEIAMEDVNAGGGIKIGEDSYKLKIIKYDHAYDPTVTVSVVRKAIYDDGVKYLDILGGGVIPAVNELCQREKVVILGTAAGTNWVGPKYFYTWKPYHDLADCLDVILQYASKKHPSYNKIIAMYPDDTLGYALGEKMPQIAEAAGFKVIGTLYNARDVTDFNPTLTGVLAKGPNIIDLGPTPASQQGYIMKQARNLGFTGIFVCPDTLDVKTVSEISGKKAMEGTLAAPQYVEMPTDVGKKWAERYINRYGSLQSWTAFNYDRVMLLKAAIEKAGTLDTTEVCNAMENLTIDGCMGKASYGGKNAYGINRFFILDVGVVEIQDGEQVEVHHGFATRWKK